MYCFMIDQTSDTRQDVHAPAVNLTQLKKTTAIREKMDVMREKRRVNELLGYVYCVFVCHSVCTVNIMIVPYVMQALGPELIPISRQSACRLLNHKPDRYFPPLPHSL